MNWAWNWEPPFQHIWVHRPTNSLSQSHFFLPLRKIDPHWNGAENGETEKRKCSSTFGSLWMIFEKKQPSKRWRENWIYDSLRSCMRRILGGKEEGGMGEGNRGKLPFTYVFMSIRALKDIFHVPYSLLSWSIQLGKISAHGLTGSAVKWGANWFPQSAACQLNLRHKTISFQTSPFDLELLLLASRLVKNLYRMYVPTKRKALVLASWAALWSVKPKTAS